MDERRVSLTAKGTVFVERMLELHFNGLSESDAYEQACREFGIDPTE